MNLDHRPSVLLTDDDALIGFDLCDALERAGYRVLGPVATAAEALTLLDRETPVLAVIDIMLKDGPCGALARDLGRRGVPFLIHSGCRKEESLAGEFQGMSWLSKPAMPQDVLALVDELARVAAVSGPEVPGPEPVVPIRLVPPDAGSSNPLIRKLESLTSLSDADRSVLARISAGTRRVGPGTDLVREGDAPAGVFLVMDGIAYRHKLRANGARQIMAYLVPGDLCDLDVALLREMDHTITTFSACKVVRLTPETVEDLLENHRSIARALRLSQLVDEATAREWLVNLGRRPARERIAHLFCELFVRMRAAGVAGQDGYALPITQVDLADTTGLTSVHVNRTLRDLRREGLIELRSGRLTILNLPGLRATAEFRANYLHLGNRAAA
ncbi:cAMP-binding domain of CRP or a regulatory subunit of cAMP-dependent protein kinases [Methylobacterium sp. UNC378MF]|uniref:helix-turn-helix domain-containing protein n=1 Tax=Methylobacterium sp. UNC378MF TaxID=1502748 RepID=UPI00087EBFE6|nr:helix-turn-helix domain-containing protein [Methylobacterium sp. UNC378MF]SDA30100.1 cAMP-binding domain of CRP or a regulatory subunit of cAMP-dependent protein kinases [Methylobacterium sp. UNC378MF]